MQPSSRPANIEEEQKFDRALLAELVKALEGELRQPLKEGMSSAYMLENLVDLSKRCNEAIGTLFHNPGKDLGWSETSSIFADAVELIYQKAGGGAVNVLSPRQLLSSEDVMLIKEKLDVINKMPSQISGRETFLLHDTYGFPKELTEEIAAENGLSIDSGGFEQEMENLRPQDFFKKLNEEGGKAPGGLE